MRTFRAALAGMIVWATVGVMPLSVAAQVGGDEPAEMTSDASGDVTVIKGLLYAKGSGPDELAGRELDVYLAAGSEDAPMVVYVPGRGLGRSSGDLLARSLAERGTTVFLMDNPDLWADFMSSADPKAIRTMVETVACAVRFARGSEYGSEVAPLVLAGFSAGGGLASHVALAGGSFDRVWEEYNESSGGPSAQYECTISEASTTVDAFVGIAGAYDALAGYEGRYGRDFLSEHEPDLWAMLWGTVGLHPELRVRLIHGDSDTTIPFENSVAFEAALAEAGYDVELTEFTGGHWVPNDLVIETVMELLR